MIESKVDVLTCRVERSKRRLGRFLGGDSTLWYHCSSIPSGWGRCCHSLGVQFGVKNYVYVVLYRSAAFSGSIF